MSRENNEYWTQRKIPNGRYPSMLGIIWSKTKFEEIDIQLVKKYGTIFGILFRGKPTIYCAEPQLISNILSKDFTVFPNRRIMSFGDDLMDNFMTIVTDDTWKRIRSIVSPAFSSAKLRKMRPIIDDCVHTLMADFNRLISETNDTNEIDVKRVFGAFTMNVIIGVAFGTKVDALCDESNAIIVNAKKLFSRQFNLLDLLKFLIIEKCPKLAKYFGFSVFPADVLRFFTELTRRLIDERRANNASIIRKYDFLQQLLDAMASEEQLFNGKNESKVLETDDSFKHQKLVITHNKTLSEAEITAQCVMFFMAGYETTATTLSYAAYNIACYPEIQQKLYEEAKRVLESETESDYDSVNTLKYLDAVICETLRLFPPGIALERTASEQYILGESGIKISAGDVIHIPVYVLHRDSKHFPEPERFKAERFFAENCSHHPYAYLPFGAGPRNCVARRMALLEAKLALLYCVYNFRFSITDKTECPPQTYSNGGLIPKQITLKVEKRN